MLRSTRITLGYKDSRRDRRYAVPPVRVKFAGDMCCARNWSLGGLLLESAPCFDVGEQFTGELQVDGRDAVFIMNAQTIRHDPDAGTLACRFVDPSPEMVGALDAAVAARFTRSRRRAAFASALLGALLAAAPQARADGPGALVPGAAPLPQFHLNFPNLLSEPLLPPPPTGDLQISLSSPDKGVMQFLFSPRSTVGSVTDADTGTSRSYAGVGWNLFDAGGFYGTLGFAGSLTRPGADDIFRREYGAPLALHSMFQLGYELGGPHSLTLSLDHSSAPDLFGDHGELNNFQLRYGLKF
jgi:hypothetical protein